VAEQPAHSASVATPTAAGDTDALRRLFTASDRQRDAAAARYFTPHEGGDATSGDDRGDDDESLHDATHVANPTDESAWVAHVHSIANHACFEGNPTALRRRAMHTLAIALENLPHSVTLWTLYVQTPSIPVSSVSSLL
jgi:hypothetical protein